MSARRELAPAALLVATLGLFECGPVTRAPNAETFNTCVAETDCASYCPPHAQSCTAGAPSCASLVTGERACVQSVDTLPDTLVLVVSVPLGSQYAPGQTMIVTRQQIVASEPGLPGNCDASSPTPCCATSSPETCVQLSPLSTPVGAYLVSPTFAASIGADFGTSNFSVPVQTRIAPSWAPPCLTSTGASCTSEGTTFPAALVGLPLETITAITLPVSTVTSPIPGASFVWEAAVPAPLSPAQKELTYSIAVEPTSQYSIVPPIAPLGGGAITPPPTTPTTVLACLTVADAEGWTLFVRDPITGEVVTSVASLVKVNAPGTCPVGMQGFTALVSAAAPDGPGTIPATGTDSIVVAPPPTLSMATLSEPYQGIPIENYPLTPPAVTVSGTVMFSNTPIRATLHFVSTVIYNSEDGGCVVEEPPVLSYETVVQTSDANTAGSVGSYSVTLPDGEYIVTIDPDPRAGAAKGAATLQGQTTTGAIAFPPLSQCGVRALSGVDLFAQNPVAVTGRVLLVDGEVGSPLANATIDLTPNLPFIYRGSTVPSASTAAADLPGSFEVTTNAQGVYTFSPATGAYVGQGTYDVTVRPADGTNLPWLVSPAHVAASSPIPDLHVPAPAPLALSLHDPVMDSPIVNAVVRAYSFNPCTAATSGTGEEAQKCYGVALEIGEAITDATGTFQLLLAPAPFVAGP